MPESAAHMPVVFAAAVAAVVLTACGGAATDAATITSSSTSSTTMAVTTTATLPPVSSSTVSPPVSSSTSLPDPFASLGEEVAVAQTVFGPVTWRRASSIPGGLLVGSDFPHPGHRYEPGWSTWYENAQEATGTCFEIFEGAAGYLGLGPCGTDWLPQRGWIDYGIQRGWHPDFQQWTWMREVWFSVDGKTWNRTTDQFFDSTAAVVATPWSVAERDGRWMVVGATGVNSDADVAWEDRTESQRQRRSFSDEDIGGLLVPKSAEPAAWVTDDLAEWRRIAVDFAEPGMDTQLTSVAAGEAGWVIFGIRETQQAPHHADWVGWASSDGIDWEELSMSGIYDNPCVPTKSFHCGKILSHVLEDKIVAYAFTWTANDPGYYEWPNWQLLLGSF